MSNRVQVPVFVDTEANLGVLAEAAIGRGARRPRRRRTSGSATPSAAGLLINGSVFHGVSGKAGQIGHVTIDENGPICRCGNRGCLETFAGGPALLELFRG